MRWFPAVSFSGSWPAIAGIDDVGRWRWLGLEASCHCQSDSDL